MDAHKTGTGGAFTKLKCLQPLQDKESQPETPPFLRVTANTPLYQKVQRILTKTEELDFVTPSVKIPQEESFSKGMKVERQDKKKGKSIKKSAKSQLDFNISDKPLQHVQRNKESPGTSSNSSKENSPKEESKDHNDQESGTCGSPHQKFFTPKAHADDVMCTEKREVHQHDQLLVLDTEITGRTGEDAHNSPSVHMEGSLVRKVVGSCDHELTNTTESISVSKEDTETKSFSIKKNLSYDTDFDCQTLSSDVGIYDKSNKSVDSSMSASSCIHGIATVLSNHPDNSATSGSRSNIVSVSPDQFFTPVCTTPGNAAGIQIDSTPVSGESGKEIKSTRHKLKGVSRPKKRRRISGHVQPLCPEVDIAQTCVTFQPSGSCNETLDDVAALRASQLAAGDEDTAHAVTVSVTANSSSVEGNQAERCSQDSRTHISVTDASCVEDSQAVKGSHDTRTDNTVNNSSAISDIVSDQTEIMNCPSLGESEFVDIQSETVMCRSVSEHPQVCSGQGLAVSCDERREGLIVKDDKDSLETAVTMPSFSPKDSASSEVFQSEETATCVEQPVTYQDIKLDDVFLDDLPLPEQQPRKRRRKRRKSADFDVINSSTVESPAAEEEMPGLPNIIGCRRSRRLRRKSLEIYRNQTMSSHEEPVEPPMSGEASDTKSDNVLHQDIISESNTEMADSNAELSSCNSGHATHVNENSLPDTQSKSTKQSSEESSDINLEKDCTLLNTGSAKLTDCISENHDTTTVSLPDLLCTESVECLDENVTCLDISGSDSGTPGRSKRRGKKKDTGPSLEDIYRNKLWRTQMPKEKKWETIYEQPQQKGRSEVLMGRNKFKRTLSEQDFYTQTKLKKRRQKALKLGWKPVTKNRHKVLDRLVNERLNSM